MRYFQDDFIISWDVSDKDCPCVSISRLREEKGKLICDVLGTSYAKDGVVSVRQLLEEFDCNGAKMDEEEATCGDCLYVELCETDHSLTEFSRDNPAYCEKFHTNCGAEMDLEGEPE